MDISNKELIEKLTEYLLNDCDPKVVARCLAGVMIDYNRLAHLKSLSAEETDSLWRRVRSNSDQLRKFARGEIKTPLKYYTMNSDEN